MPGPNTTTVYVLLKGIFLSTRGKNVCRKVTLILTKLITSIQAEYFSRIANKRMH
jgi:hypothetical protein